MFKIGDIVIGKKEASSIYRYTKEGWIGKVVNIVDENKIEVKSEEFSISYTVYGKFFNHVDNKKLIKYSKK
jgi:hypothetical protein